MGFMVSKGQLEIDIIVVKGLSKSGLVQPPGKENHPQTDNKSKFKSSFIQHMTLSGNRQFTYQRKYTNSSFQINVLLLNTKRLTKMEI